MPKTKVLIVDSVEDKITRRRHALFARSELLLTFALEYCYAIELPESEKAKLDFGFAPDFQLTENSLFERVDTAVRSFEPDCVMVHSGFVYRRFSEAYRKAFARLKQMHPKIPVGIQLRPGMTVDSTAFDSNEFVHGIHDLIFVRVLEKGA